MLMTSLYLAAVHHDDIVQTFFISRGILAAVFAQCVRRLFSSGIEGALQSTVKTALSGVSLLPVNTVLPGGICDDVVCQLQTAFSSDLPARYSMPQKIERWVCKWKKVEPGQLPKTLSETLQAVDDMSFPNITCILRLLLIAPVTSASVERDNSALAFVKTELRSTMSETHLKNLILLFVHKDIKLDYNEIVDIFAIKVPRRMLLVDPCNHDDDEY